MEQHWKHIYWDNIFVESYKEVSKIKKGSATDFNSIKIGKQAKQNKTKPDYRPIHIRICLTLPSRIFYSNNDVT